MRLLTRIREGLNAEMRVSLWGILSIYFCGVFATSFSDLLLPIQSTGILKPIQLVSFLVFSIISGALFIFNVYTLHQKEDK